MSEKLVWIDGQIMPASEFRMDPEDEGLLFGRGVFTTTRTFGGKPWLWDRHTERLLTSAKLVGIPIDRESLPSVVDVARFVERWQSGDRVVRVNVASSKCESKRRIWMISRPLPDLVDSVRLTVSPYWHGVDGFSGLKSFNYLTRHLAFEDAKRRGFDDAIMLAPTRHILETAHSNLFVWITGNWYTAPSERGVLNGTVRQVVLKGDRRIVEEFLIAEDLTMAEEVVVTNSVLGVVPVREIDGREYRTTEETRLLQRIVANSRALDTRL